MHIHTNFSCDCQTPMETVCQAALARGLEEIAITDHVDWEPQDEGYARFRPQAYWTEIERCRALFAGQLTIRAGVELGEPHRFRQEAAELLARYEYDLVLGSLHWSNGRPAWERAFFGDDLGLDEGLALYFAELYTLASEADYDVLTHLDFVRRAAYLCFGVGEPDLRPHEAQIRRVLRAVAERGKGLEVNTNTCRKGLGGPGASLEALRWFRQAGGRIVTFGSDAHRAEDVGADLDRALAVAREAGFDRPARWERRVAHSTRIGPSATRSSI